MLHEVNDRAWVKAFYDSAAEWWGESWYEGENLPARLERVRRHVGPPPKKLLELGAGTGETAAYLAAAGYRVTALDISDANYALLRQVAQKYPSVTPVQGDFYTTAVEGRFDAVCLFEVFGMGTDAEQRRLLRRIADEWLAPGGVALVDVYNPFGPVRKAGEEWQLERLENVPGSVDMTERSYFDVVLGRWIDEWEPLEHPENARRQSVRCYTPADLLLLLEGTGLRIAQAEFCGQPFDPRPSQVAISSPLQEYEKDYTYFVVLQHA